MRRVERWAGLTRTVSNWDGLRRDPELWDDNGDCLVHLYAVGQSRRGPSFCVPFRLLKQSNCASMFSLCLAQRTKSPPANVSASNRVDLYIPAPEDATREASFQWHITTRNFFAFVLGKPLVGNHLGQAMVDLQERMRLFRSERVDNQQDFLKYADAQGYRDFVDFPDYALAVLFYAEHFKLRDAWIDAFAHCVGMNEKLILSPEFSPQSRLTKALITRAYLEMDISLDRTSTAVRNFLEDDLSPAYLGLTGGARYHLDRFRSFLHSYYVDKFGYWPPPRGTTFSKALFRSLYFDFKKLYDYLVDSDSTADLASQKLASGGICVLQNVDSFDKRRRFPPLPHPLPLLPSELSPSRTKRTKSQRSLRPLSLGTKQAKEERFLSVRAALIMATNGDSDAPIIQAYMRFERQCVTNSSEEKTSIADARKVRWLLIYGTLQYLISALRAPTEVRDTEGPMYPLCCLVNEPMQWQRETRTTTFSSTRVPAAVAIATTVESTETPFENLFQVPRDPTIEPDCQAYDYLFHTNTDPGSRRGSVEVPAPLRIPQSSRTSSIRSRRRLSLSSLSPNRNGVSHRQQMHNEILAHGYGNVLNDTCIVASADIVSRTTSLTNRASQDAMEPNTSWLRPSTPESSPYCCNQRSQEAKPCCNMMPKPLRTRQDETICTGGLPNSDFADLTTPQTTRTPPESSSSPDSTSSHWWSDGASCASSKSSTHDEHFENKISPAEECGLLGGLVPIINSTTTPFPVTPIRRSSLHFRSSKQPSSAEVWPAGAIGVAITGPYPLENDVSPSTCLKASESFQLDKNNITRISTRKSQLAPSSKRALDVPPPLPSNPNKNSALPEQDQRSSKRSSSRTRSFIIGRTKSSSERNGRTKDTEIVRAAGGNRNLERRLSFWRR